LRVEYLNNDIFIWSGSWHDSGCETQSPIVFGVSVKPVGFLMFFVPGDAVRLFQSGHRLEQKLAKVGIVIKRDLAAHVVKVLSGFGRVKHSPHIIGHDRKRVKQTWRVLLMHFRFDQTRGYTQMAASRFEFHTLSRQQPHADKHVLHGFSKNGFVVNVVI
jgi:hypothetical protein